ncbi:hypothetical protein BDV98DRAFT_195214 [Pterulicium gracile]|uniref:F-box domain-containing protein n=1 Tax=Pterulicium gracile TaxID=1884261 RepID=A0A5C3QAN7_9AGAR|nr:hypothetical protein BDV98DRAFT_195214 [Pterula gracilis]
MPSGPKRSHQSNATAPPKYGCSLYMAPTVLHPPHRSQPHPSPSPPSHSLSLLTQQPHLRVQQLRHKSDVQSLRRAISERCQPILEQYHGCDCAYCSGFCAGDVAEAVEYLSTTSEIESWPFRTRKRACPCCHLHSTSILHRRTLGIVPNTHPGESGCKRARTELESAQWRLRALNSAINHLRKQRDYISQVFIPHWRSALAPIARVPDDILLHIFDFYLQLITHPPRTPTTSDAQSTEAHPTQLTLCMVSRRWRSLTISYQYRWSFVPRRSDHLAGSSRCNPNRRLEVQLQRSGNATLSVDFQSCSIAEQARLAL